MTMEIPLQEDLLPVCHEVHPRCKPKGFRVFTLKMEAIFLRNVVSYKIYMASHSRRQRSSVLPPCITVLSAVTKPRMWEASTQVISADVRHKATFVEHISTVMYKCGSRDDATSGIYSSILRKPE
jgi:hypothetical protein